MITKFKGKEIGKPITPPSESASEEDSDPEKAQRDKDMNQRTVTIAGARQIETKKGERLHVYKEKMLLCKQAKKGVPLQVEKSDWLADTDEEIDEQELEAHYSFMAKIQEVPTVDSGTDTKPLEQVQYNPEYNLFANERQHFEQPESISNTCEVEKVDSNDIPDSPDICDNDIQTDQNVIECEDKRVVLANLIENLKLDVNENKRIQKQFKKVNTSLAHELEECKSILAKTIRTLGESNSIQDSCLITLQNKQTELERFKAGGKRMRDTTGLSSENIKLKIQLQAMGQQAQYAILSAEDVVDSLGRLSWVRGESRKYRMSIPRTVWVSGRLVGAGGSEMGHVNRIARAWDWSGATCGGVGWAKRVMFLKPVASKDPWPEGTQRLQYL
ncbi:hypothetical protein Tco_1211237 [Tanacetum coccineum]